MNCKYRYFSEMCFPYMCGHECSVEDTPNLRKLNTTLSLACGICNKNTSPKGFRVVQNDETIRGVASTQIGSELVTL